MNVDSIDWRKVAELLTPSTVSSENDTNPYQSVADKYNKTSINQSNNVRDNSEVNQRILNRILYRSPYDKRHPLTYDTKKYEKYGIYPDHIGRQDVEKELAAKKSNPREIVHYVTRNFDSVFATNHTFIGTTELIFISIIAVIVIIIARINHKANQNKECVKSSGGMRVKYAKLLENILDGHRDSRIFIETQTYIKAGVSNYGGSTFFHIQQTTDGKVTMQYEVKDNPIVKAFKLEWTFKDDLDQEEMMAIIAEDIHKKIAQL